MNKQIYQIHISLKDISPRIWRRILVDSETTLDYLHSIIQVAMGWGEYHPHQFSKNKKYYSTRSESKIKLDSILKKEKERLKYEYDFGDGWIHNILLEKIFTNELQIELPKCISGKRNCPPEDIGGVFGYYDLVENQKNYSMYKNYNPDEFNMEKVNRQL